MVRFSMSLDYNAVFPSILFVFIREFSDLDEVYCSGSDGHIAATNQLPVYEVCLFGPFASTFLAFLCNLFFILTVLRL